MILKGEHNGKNQHRKKSQMQKCTWLFYKMNGKEELEKMSLSELITGGGGVLLILLTIIQIAPIKVNPWSKIARSIGRAMNVEIMDKLNESEATDARYRIIRFDDEIRHHVKHTEEHFNQIMSDIDEYERYCSTHPDYKNSKAVMAIENVRRTYQKCRKENSFLV